MTKKKNSPTEGGSNSGAASNTVSSEIDPRQIDMFGDSGVALAPDVNAGNVVPDTSAPPWEDDGFGDIQADPDAELDAAMAVQVTENVEKHLKLVETLEFNSEQSIEAARSEPDLVKRARMLAKLQAFAFPEAKTVVMQGQPVRQAMSSDTNRYYGFDILFGNGPDRPHLDTFSGRIVDHNRRVFDDRYPMVELVNAFTKAGMQSQSADQLRKAYREWALLREQSDLALYFEQKIPAWDESPRLETFLIRFFDSADTKINRDFSRYFWLSLYARIMHPGCMAPMVLSLFGPQKSGKSYIAKRICQTLMGDPGADSVQLNLGGDKNDFLRDITGASIIASVGEMSGFTRSDLNAVKDFSTRVSDRLHQKFEGNYTQQRQWVIMMDGNSYDGLQRDSSGNRRFFPMFVAQNVDAVTGEPVWDADGRCWRPTYRADFTGFDEQLWQIMAECRAWFAENGGLTGYEKYTDQVSEAVFAFNNEEMRNDRGTIKDDGLETHLVPVLVRIKPVFLDHAKNQGAWVATNEIEYRYGKACRDRLNKRHLATKMSAMGAEAVQYRNVKGYLFRDVMDMRHYQAFVYGVPADGLDDESLEKELRFMGQVDRPVDDDSGF